MAENKGIMLAKSVQKHAGRAKEKILQNLGKVDRTADEIFDDHLNNFNRQQGNANRLQKEFNNYIRCIRAAQVASKSLMDAICEIYEPQWTGYDALQGNIANSESLWIDFAHKLGDQVLIPLNTYTGQFPEMKKKVEKRNRKLIDYDSQRHSFQSLQANANKRKDDVKLTKGREQLEEARRTYEILNTELHDELPALYDSRILFLVTNLQTLFATEQVFHTETSKIYAELEAIVDKLATDSQRGSNTLRKQTSNAIKTSSPVQSPIKTSINNTNNYQNSITTNGASNANSPTSSSSLQDARFDSISSTPESTTPTTPIITSDMTPAKATTTTTTTTTTSNSDSSSPVISASAGIDGTSEIEPSYQNVAAASITTTTTTSATDEKQLNSPNANSTVATTTTSSPTTTPKAGNFEITATKSTTTTATNEIVTPNAESASITTTTTTTITEKVVTPTSPIREHQQQQQFNGNGNEHGSGSNNNINNNNAITAAGATATANNNNNNDNNNANTSNGNIEDASNKKAIGKANIKNQQQQQEQEKQQQQNKQQDYNRILVSNTKLINTKNANPFEDDEQIYEVPKGE